MRAYTANSCRWIFAKGIIIPPKFCDEVRSTVEVGATMLLTDVSAVDIGEKVTVVAAD